MIDFKPGVASWAFLPSWIIIGAVAVLLPFFGYMTYHNINRQNENAHRMLTEKGAALIRSFEAGTRTGMGMMGLGAKFNLIHLLKETAQQPDIKYLFLADADGRILVHSDPEKMSTQYGGDLDLAAVSGDNILHSRETTAQNGDKVFEVYRRFILNPFPGHPGRHHPNPLYRLGDILERLGPGSGPGPRPGPGRGQGRGQGPGRGLGRGPDRGLDKGPEEGLDKAPDKDPDKGVDKDPQEKPDKAPDKDPDKDLGLRPAPPIAPVIVVGLDMSAIQEAGKTDARHFLIMGGVFLLLGFSGIILLFMAYNYQAAKTSLSRIKAFSDNVVQHMPIGLLATDARGRVVSVNQYGAALLGVKPHKLLHRPAKEGLPPELAGEIEPSADSAGPGPVGPGPVGPMEKEIVCRLTPDEEIPLEITRSGLYDENDGFLGHILLFKDLTEVKALQKEIYRTQRLATVGRLAAGVAHEIRNPLSSIKGFGHLFQGAVQGRPQGPGNRRYHDPRGGPAQQGGGPAFGIRPAGDHHPPAGLHDRIDRQNPKAGPGAGGPEKDPDSPGSGPGGGCLVPGRGPDAPDSFEPLPERLRGHGKRRGDEGGGLHGPGGRPGGHRGDRYGIRYFARKPAPDF